MGVTDKLWFRLTCSNCGAAETLSVLDKGSTWSGSSWGVLPDPKGFAVVQGEKGPGGEPDIAAATCKVCGSPAKVESSYGFKAPDGW